MGSIVLTSASCLLPNNLLKKLNIEVLLVIVAVIHSH
jgi:hypothetical protein